MKKAEILSAICFLLASFTTFSNATQKIVTFDYDIITKQAGEKELQSIDGKIVRELKIINALVAIFPDYVKDSMIYTLKGVINVEEDSYYKWIESENQSFADITIPSVKEIIGKIKSANEDAPLSIPQHTNSEEVVKSEIPWGIERVDAEGAWNITQGEMAKVAILDTGVDFSHPDLAPNYAGGYNAITPETSPLDDHGHGTHVAGTIAAVKDEKGVVGVAPKAKIYGVKVLNASGSGTYSGIIAGIEWCVENDIDIINMSLGGRNSIDSFHLAVKAAYKKGITIVCAAGNDGKAVNYPAKYAETLGISASTSLNAIAYFSSRGPEIDFIAPGLNIYSTYKGGKYTTMSGTSMACPHVTGLAALAVSLGHNSPAKVKAALTKAAIDIGLAEELQGAGLIKAGKINSATAQ